ncbi:uncharacterized protein B0P05DRAFT_533678 [Gilbertella persicaria]|nr:uncharacterized protein B0P05DRAFT_533678 [Gilbertella persicaria]KAI8085781.1 hypothetical protein B0P05DRAFT_533678 [Gilbertella persicaria]
MASYYHIPKQKRAFESTKALKTYFKSQGISEDNDPIPSMAQIVDYCERHPRLLRIRDSVLKNLHDPNAPHHVVHNYYVESALDYLEGSLFVLFEHWETDYKKKRHDTPQMVALFSALVKDIYKCHTDTLVALNMPFPEGSALTAVELKRRVIQANLALIHEKISYSFHDIKDTFYTQAIQQIETWFWINHHINDNTSFAPLFSRHIAKYQDEELERQVQLILDTEPSKLYDVFNLPVDILNEASQRSNSIQDIKVNQWFIKNEANQEYQLEKLDENIKEFALICDTLNNLKLTPNWIHLLKPKIRDRLVHSKWKDDWQVSMVDIQLKWLHTLVLPWLSHIIPHTDNIDKNWYSFIREKIKAEHVLYEMIYEFRVPAIFDIIREYPSTHNVIQDFHIVATKRGLLNDLKDRLMEELLNRLLHQGASAVDILQQYIACIQCLTIIDPSCSIMVPVIDLIGDYTKTYRNDIVQGVVELIRDAEEHEILARRDEDIFSFKQSELNDEQEPIDTVVIKEDKTAMLRRLQRKSKDPVAMLISMCKSLKDFIREYSDKLGQILLTSKGYDTDEEVRKLEMLKQNFPPEAFLRCDIMLRDMDDSRRLDKSVHEKPGVASSFHAIIMSRKYWPGGDEEDKENDQQESDIPVWPEHKESIESYNTEYQKVKASRKLKFLPHKGSVTLDLTFASRTLTVDVSPEAALIIRLFEAKSDAFTREQIADRIGIEKKKAVDALEFWINQEVLRLSGNGYYTLIEE